MKLDDIMSSWEEDSNSFDKKQLTEESVKSITLHTKYYKILVQERLRLASLQNDKRILTHLKTEYYMGDLDFETLKEKGWKPFNKKILKSDINRYLEADEDIISLNLKIVIQEEKVLALKEIVDTLNRRSFTIKNIIEWEKFKAGEY